MRIKNRNKGFTLIEMSISTMILCVIGVAMGGLMIQGVRGWTSGTNQDAIAGSVTLAMQRLDADIRDGVTATVTTANGTQTLVVTFAAQISDTTTEETIYDTSNTATSTRSYYVQNGNLVRNVGGVISTIGKGVSNASFIRSGNLVTITLMSSGQVGTSRKSLQITSKLRLRNYHT